MFSLSNIFCIHSKSAKFSFPQVLKVSFTAILYIECSHFRVFVHQLAWYHTSEPFHRDLRQTPSARYLIYNWRQFATPLTISKNYRAHFWVFSHQRASHVWAVYISLYTCMKIHILNTRLNRLSCLSRLHISVYKKIQMNIHILYTHISFCIYIYILHTHMSPYVYIAYISLYVWKYTY